MHRSLVAISLAISFTGIATAADALPSAKPIPALQVLPLPYDQASIERGGSEIARYHFGPTLRRPFVYPLIGASGKSLTRMGHPRDPHSHSHHNSVWISHHDVNGVSFWGDTGKGRITTPRIIRYEDADDEALIQAQHAWIDDAGKTLLDEVRTLRFQSLAGGEWRLVIDLELSAKQPVTLGKTPFGITGVRMAKTIGVHDGGGRILNSSGGVNEKDVFWKPATWVDYSGPVAPESRGGVTLMDHPANPNHPSVFHVRDDGWMGASLTFDAPRTIEPDTPLKLRYGLWVHAGVPDVEAVNAQFTAFREIGEPPAKK